ncbi:MAG: hypothetical protein HYV13_03965 [Candidatus Doudnabacteria bacterium]|nr:hypothetical protein [Candidatus Doudnabacteria bacterium]
MTYWKKMITREATLLERYLKTLGYATNLSGTKYCIGEILIVAEHELPVMYFGPNEIPKKLRIIQNDYKTKVYKRLFKSSCSILTQLIRLTDHIEQLPPDQPDQIIESLKNYFNLYIQARAIVAYCIPQPELELLLKKELLKFGYGTSDELFATLVYPVINASNLEEFFHPDKALVEKKLRLLNKLKPSTAFKELIKYFEWRFYLHEVAELVTTKYSFPKFQKFLEKIVRQNEIPKKDLVWYRPEEILQSVKRSWKLLQVEVKKRRSFYVLVLKNQTWLLYSGREAQKIAAKELGPQGNISSKINTLSGTTAQAGKASGKVVILMTAKNIKAVKNKSIIVTSMTRPQWLPAIKKASAIVTDEGGMLCHAAIVSRELKKPCVIGTKFATKIFKDGDLVEVDANKGIVRLVLNKKPKDESRLVRKIK